MPSVLYHHSHPNNRQSILQHGLLKKYDANADPNDSMLGGIFFSNKPDFTTRSDVWEVDVRGLPVEEDPTTQVPPESSADEAWYVVYQDIPPNRIKLITRK